MIPARQLAGDPRRRALEQGTGAAVPLSPVDERGIVGVVGRCALRAVGVRLLPEKVEGRFGTRGLSHAPEASPGLERHGEHRPEQVHVDPGGREVDAALAGGRLG